MEARPASPCCGCRSSTKNFNDGQKYDRLKRRCTSTRTLFEDAEFPADDSSLKLGADAGRYRDRIQWKRPTELCANPKLVVGRLDSSNITQGALGNCWFVAACCALARVERLFNKVVPDRTSQDWQAKGSFHGGIFHFRIWRFGQWTTVVVDDRLPTVNGQLMFAHSQVHDEFWCALLEKAYAKIFGSYSALESGNLVDALVDFTAGFAERIDLVAADVARKEIERLELFARLERAFVERRALMCCAIKVLGREEMERRTAHGLVKGHAYCITGVRRVNIARTGLFAFFHDRQRLNMVRLRNPWGEKEWSGPFGDSDDVWCYSTARLQRFSTSSAEWTRVSASDRKKIGLTYEDDGEFWMTFEDFCKHFTDLSICNLVNTSLLSLRRTWHEYAFFGRWSEGPKLSRTDRSGGCSNHADTFLRNPQYRFEIGDGDDRRLMVMLQQEDVRGKSRRRTTTAISFRNSGSGEDAKLLSIGFEILKVEVNRKHRLHGPPKRIVAQSDYGETRNIFREFRLGRGVYVLLPTTFTPRRTGNYLLRMFATDDIHVKELKSEMPKAVRCFCVSGEYRQAAVIRVREGSEIREPGSLNLGALDTYFVLSCGSNKVRGPTIKEQVSPRWDTEAIFYLTDDDDSTKVTAKIQVWSSALFKDKLIGEADFEMQESRPPKTVAKKITLMSLATPSGTQSQCGSVIVEMLVTSNMLAI